MSKSSSLQHVSQMYNPCILSFFQTEGEHLNLKVTGQDGSVVHFKIKKNTPLRKLMSAYCERTVGLNKDKKNSC